MERVALIVSLGPVLEHLPQELSSEWSGGAVVCMYVSPQDLD